MLRVAKTQGKIGRLSHQTSLGFLQRALGAGGARAEWARQTRLPRSPRSAIAWAIVGALLPSWAIAACGSSTAAPAKSSSHEAGGGSSSGASGGGGNSSSGDDGSTTLPVADGGTWPNCDAAAPNPTLSGSPGTWVQATLPGLASGDRCESVVVDAVNPGTLITGCGANDGRKIKWYRTTDYGETWALTNDTTMGGNPWGFSMETNPNRDPCTPPTLYSPAGYGSLGAWKSTDGAVTWSRLTGADTAFSQYNPAGTAATDLYHVALLPDDPPNHVLTTYHYYFKGNTEGGFGETWDGGKTWVVHPPPRGVGTSHYVIPISGTTWCVIAQNNNGTNGVWRTATAGRTGGTAANKYRDGTISASAWSMVSTHEHVHGSYAPVKVGSTWYSPGWTSIWKSTDDGATWMDMFPGSYWPSPPAPAFTNKNMSGLIATPTYIYSNYFMGPDFARAPVGQDTNWTLNYAPVPSGLSGVGAEPFGNAVTKHPSGKWLVFMGTNIGVWRYIEN
jgi:hypothetical protein